MELTEENLNKERLDIEDLIIGTYGRYSREHNDMMFAVNLYYQGLIQILHKN